MGDQVPIAVGYCLATRTLTLSIVGDASAEEDYVLGALGFAAHKGLPFLLVCEDNDYSILTPKSARRGWNLTTVAAAFGCEAHETSDDPIDIRRAVTQWDRQGPLVLNILTSRHLWHAGSGQDAKPTFDRYEALQSEISRRYGPLAIKEFEDQARVALTI
jgi:pyruvate dehydrogenase E1 component alpha subunit